MFGKQDLDDYLRKDIQMNIVTSTFDVIQNYIEDTLAGMEVELNNEYPLVTRLIVRFVPVRFRRQLSRQLGLMYLESKLQLLKVATLQEADNKLKELYLWYVDEFPLLKNPYAILSDPEYFFITGDGTPTNQMFSMENGRGVVNNFHPDYIKFLNDVDNIKKEHNNLIDTKMNELIQIRKYL